MQMKKSKGYWQKKENVLSEALKYKTRKEFIKGCKSAYNSALSNGWIDEVSAHFNIERNNYDIKQKINIVYSYEFQELMIWDCGYVEFKKIANSLT